MDPSIVTALAALAGAVIGSLTSVVASTLAQRKQAHAQWITQERLRRQELYKEFIEEATKCHIDALQHNEGDIPALVVLYSKIGRMRTLSSPKVIHSAEQIGKKSLIPIRNQTRRFESSGTWSVINQLIFFVISVRRAVKN